MTPASAADNAHLEMAKADAALRAARALLGLDLGDDAVSRAYYAAYHAAIALLYSAGLQARTPTGTQDLLFEHFVFVGRLPRTVTRCPGRARAPLRGGEAPSEMVNCAQSRVGPIVPSW